MNDAEEMEEMTWKRRRHTFVEEGLPFDDATDLALRMMRRDRENGLDDRRVCFECTHYVSKYCHRILDKHERPTRQLRFILQRCDYFQLKGKK